MDTDAVLVEIGEFGKFQFINYLLICLPVLFSAGNSLTYVFTAGIPNYRCYVPGCDDSSEDYSAWFVEDALPPKDPSSTVYEPSQCSMFRPANDVGNVTEGSNSTCLTLNFTLDIVKCDKWVYEENEWTIVGEYDITCAENQWLLSLVGTVHFIGILVGTAFFGYWADRYGRKRVFIFCIVLMSLTGIAQALSPDYITFQVFVFLNALGTSGVFPLAFILGVELVGKSKREMSGVVLNYFYAVGEALVGVIAWLTKNWISLQLLLSTPPIVFVIYYWFIPESVRWLVANKQFKEAGSIFKRAAKVNGVKLSQKMADVFDGECQIDSSSSEEFKLEEKMRKDGTGNSNTTRMWSAFKKIIFSRKLLYRSLLLFYLWAANAFVYYGLSVNSTSLGGNKYLNFILVCLIEIPGYTMSWWMMNNWGRRWSLSVSLFLCSVTCLGAAFVPDHIHWAVVTLFLIGKLGITSSFGVVYVYTAELYPTIVRSIGVGVSSTMARFGAIVAPFAPLLGTYSKPLPLLLFGAVSLIAGLIVLLLPETLGTKLPDTVEEAENLKLVRESTTSSESYSYNDNL